MIRPIDIDYSSVESAMASEDLKRTGQYLLPYTPDQGGDATVEILSDNEDHSVLLLVGTNSAGFQVRRTIKAFKPINLAEANGWSVYHGSFSGNVFTAEGISIPVSGDLTYYLARTHKAITIGEAVYLTLPRWDISVEADLVQILADVGSENDIMAVASSSNPYPSQVVEANWATVEPNSYPGATGVAGEWVSIYSGYRTRTLASGDKIIFAPKNDITVDVFTQKSGENPKYHYTAPLAGPGNAEGYPSLPESLRFLASVIKNRPVQLPTTIEIKGANNLLAPANRMSRIRHMLYSSADADAWPVLYPQPGQVLVLKTEEDEAYPLIETANYRALVYHQSVLPTPATVPTAYVQGNPGGALPNIVVNISATNPPEGLGSYDLTWSILLEDQNGKLYTNMNPLELRTVPMETAPDYFIYRNDSYPLNELYRGRSNVFIVAPMDNFSPITRAHSFDNADGLTLNYFAHRVDNYAYPAFSIDVDETVELGATRSLTLTIEGVEHTFNFTVTE